MSVRFSLGSERFNTQYAPLGVLLALYHQKQILRPLKNVILPAKTVRYSSADKLQQVLVSVFAGCETLSEVNFKLKGGVVLARAGGWERFADQSTLSLTLDALTLMNIDQLRMATRRIWQTKGRATAHDWRGFLWLDYDLSGLPSGKQAEGSRKGYFSGKKTSGDGNWRASAPLIIRKPSGLRYIPATGIPSTACLTPCKGYKVH